MIVMPRGLARSFRAVARKCAVGRARGPSPPVLIVVNDGKLTLTKFGEVAVSVEAESATSSDIRIMVSMDLLEMIEGNGTAELTVSDSEVTAQWETSAGVRSEVFKLLVPDQLHDLPGLPDKWSEASSDLLLALHECGRTTAKDSSTRFDLERVQVNGKEGTVVATNGVQALLWGGLAFSFKESLLIPAIPVFGTKDLINASEVRVGCTADHLVVRADQWTVWLAIDKTGNYPKVEDHIPKSYSASVAVIDETDAEYLIGVLPELPQTDEEDTSVTLDLDGGVKIRTKTRSAGKVREIPLVRSTTSGPPLRIAVDRKFLAKALSLGCVTIRLLADKPIVCEAPNLKFVTMPRDRAFIVLPAGEKPKPQTTNEPERKMIPMKSTENNGHNGLPDPSNNGNGTEVLDPLAEAESLRATLVDATTRANRLVQSLKQYKKERRVLSSAWSSLKSLGLGGGQ
jgi:hypothetical protein